MRNQINTKKPYLCIDCGTPVKRRRKRCPACDHVIKKTQCKYERTSEHKATMSKTMKGRQQRGSGWKHSKKTREKMKSVWTPEMKEDARIRGLLNAENREWLLKIAESVSDSKNPNFQNKSNKSGYALGWGKGYRKRMRDRANGICEMCGKPPHYSSIPLDLHHKDFTLTNHAPENLAVLCRKCHKKVHAEHKRFLQGLDRP